MERSGQRRARKIAAVIILLFAVGLVQDRARLLHEGQRSVQWPAVVGEVLDSQASQIAGGRIGRAWTIRVRYAYELDGQRYEGERIAFSRQLGGGTRVQVQDALRQYVPGGPVLIYHDPLRPQRAVLRPGPDQRAYFGLTVGLGLIAIAVLFWLVPTRTVKKRRSAS